MTTPESKNIFGQGLLEVIVALGIITSGVIGMLSLALANQNSSGEAAARLVAVNLAREAMELARSKRDSNWLAQEDWDKDLQSGTDYTAVPFFDQANNSWSLDFTANDINHNFAKVWLQKNEAQPNEGIFFQADFSDPPADTQATAYRRLLKLDPICENEIIVESGAACSGEKIGLRLQSQVAWNFKGNEKNVILEERIFDWR